MKIYLIVYSSLILILAFITSLLAQDQLTAKIKYLSAENVYLDKGTLSGIQTGDKFTVFQDEIPVGYLEVIFVASHSASCKIINQNKKFLIGDIAVRTFKSTITEDPEKTDLPKRKREIPISKTISSDDTPIAKFSGSVSVQWYQYNDVSGNNLNFNQPALRLNLKVRQLWSSQYNFTIKMRSRYSNRSKKYSNNLPKQKWSNRIYSFGLDYTDANKPFNFKVGRIISEKFGGIGYIDGAVVQYNSSTNLNIGLFGGYQPEWQYSKFQTSLQKYGIYMNYRKGSYQSHIYESTLAAAGEYHGKTISREFIYMQNQINYRHQWQFFQSVSLDINRAWRKKLTGESISISNLYIYGRYRFSDKISAGLSYDNRKNYLTYETKTIAEEIFDSAFRQGLRTNLYVSFPNKYNLSTNIGIRKHEPESELTYSYHISLNKSDLFINRSRADLSVAGYSNKFTRGVNPSISWNYYLARGHTLGFSGGTYFYNLKDGNMKRSTNWMGLESFIHVFKKIFLFIDYEYNWGDDAEGHRILSELGYRF